LVGDTDNDGLSDGSEAEQGTDPNDPDSDQDGLYDGDEVDFGTNPRDPDSDNGGTNDGDELNSGTDPLDGDDDGIADDPLEPGEFFNPRPPPAGTPGTPSSPIDDEHIRVARGCGCDSSSAPTALMGAPLLLLGLMRRRR